MEKIIEEINKLYAMMKEKNAILENGLAQLELDKASLDERKSSLDKREDNIVPIENIMQRQAELNSLEMELGKKSDAFQTRESKFLEWMEKNKAEIVKSKEENDQLRLSLDAEYEALNEQKADLEEQKNSYKEQVKDEFLKNLGK